MIGVGRVGDWMLAAGLALFVLWAIYDYGWRSAVEDIGEQSKRVEESLRTSAPVIEETDRDAIKEGEKADANARTAEDNLRTAHETKPDGQCRPVPAHCFGAGVVRLRQSGP